MLAAVGAAILLGLLSSRPPTAPVPTPTLAAPRFPLAAHAPGEVINWLRREAMPFGRTGSKSRTYQHFLREFVGSARVVGFGESTHGSHDFFRLKRDTYELLATHLGFNVFAIEAGFPESLAVNDYVLHGTGTAEAALKSLQVWSYTDVLELIRWIRAYNTDPRHARKLRFYGFDMQTSAAALERLTTYLRRVDPSYAASVQRKALDSRLWVSQTQREFAAQSEATRRAASELPGELLSRLERQKEDYVTRSSRDAWEIAARCATVLLQYMTNVRAPQTGLRDLAMADNVRWILDHEGADARVMLWAHNGHVAAGRRTYEYIPMGAHLRAALGREYAVAGLFFDRGTVYLSNASDKPAVTEVKPARQGSLEATIARVCREICGVDFRRLPSRGIARDWFSSKRWVSSIGGVYGGGAPLLDDYPAESYDAVIFIGDIRAATPLPRLAGAPTARLVSAPQNLDFAMGSADEVPPVWTLGGNFGVNGAEPYVARTSAAECRTAPCVVLSGTSLPGSYGTIMQTFGAGPYRGKRVVFEAFVRAEVLPDCRAGLWLRVDRGADVEFFDNMANRPITDNRWSNYRITADVSQGADFINIGVLLVGSGRALVDDVRFHLHSEARPRP